MTGGDRLGYEQRVNRVIDHIRDHLGEELSLAALARVAAFSPFHFHRVFKAITGETLFGFIQRLRIERAAGALVAHRDQSILEVALDHAFAGSATFARAFKARFGMSATEWRHGGADRWRKRYGPEAGAARPLRKAGKAIGKRGKARRRVRGQTSRKRFEEDAMSIRIATLPPYHVAYMRYVGPYGPHGIPALWQRFHKWMQTRDVAVEGRITLGIGHDDPNITPAERCRYDACVVVRGDFAPDRWVNLMDVPGGKCAVWEFTGPAREIEAAWQRVFSAWLPDSGYQPDDRPCVELYRGDPSVGAEPGSFRCDLCLPVRPL